VSAPTTPRPADPRPDVDERATLVEFLDYYRTVFLRKAEGLSDDEVRLRTCPPSDLSVLGLVRHMGEVERAWFRRRFGEDIDYIYDYSEDDDADLHPGDDATLADALAAWRAEIDIGRTNLTSWSLDDIQPAGREPHHSVRWMLVHMIEEYARHCGHLDLLREQIDGEIGD
jgi:hypothetical protein